MRLVSLSKNSIAMIQGSLLSKHLRQNLNQTANFMSKRYEKKPNFAKYIGMLLLGSGAYLLINKYTHENKLLNRNDDPVLNIDLNEVYEKTAAVFLSNAELREALGMPIKITSSDELDQIRSINLRREGKVVYAFIAYDLQGSINSGQVFCKLRMNESNQKFKTESIMCKLSKPDSKNRREIFIQSK